MYILGLTAIEPGTLLELNHFNDYQIQILTSLLYVYMADLT